MKFYTKLPFMELLSGDTLPTFHVQVEGAELEGCTMKFIISAADSPDTAVISKDCTAEEGGFAVQLTSADTSELTEGTYLMHFCLTNAASLTFRKLAGKMYVHSVPEGGSQT